MISLLALPLVSGCKNLPLEEKIDHIDRPLNLSRDDYRDMYNQDPERAKQNTKVDLNGKALSPPVPDIAPLLAAPRPPKIGNTKLVSIAVTDDVPLRDVLVELARLADVDVELDSGITGGIDFRAKDKPFNEVVERIANLAGLRYSFKAGVLRVERDLPYIRNYSLDFLNVVRSSEGKVSISTDVASIAGAAASGGGGGGSAGGGGGGGGGGSGGITTGSNSTINSKADDDFWDSLNTGIKSILIFEQPSLSAMGGDKTTLPGTPGAAAPAASGAAATLPPGVFYVVNRQAGVLSVAATQHQHETIERYLEQVKANASAQVLIEAKVVEVVLDEEFKSGIKWSKIGGRFNFSIVDTPTQDAANVTTGILGNEIPSALDPKIASTLTRAPSSGLDGAVQLMSQFGTTRTLSSPRLHAINNQPAVLTFAQNLIFFEVQVTTTPPTISNNVAIPGTTAVNTTRQSVPIGIIMTILPSIDLAANAVTLSVHPTLTRKVASVIDPGSALVSSISNTPTFTNEVPIIEVRELDSILKLRSGQIMVIGGLMEQGSNNTDAGVPWLSDLPVVGNAFKSVQKDDHNRELVIFIRATIVSQNGSYSPADRLTYDKFTKDPRPLAF